VLGFIGITDMTIIRAEGTNLGPDAVQKAMISAHQQIDRLFVLPLAA
jgi:FMN-dependent NADH-azoreductase